MSLQVIEAMIHHEDTDAYSSVRHAETKHEAAGKFKALLEEFYSDSPERLKASLFGLGLTVKKPASDSEQD